MPNGRSPNDFRSPLARDAQMLLARVVDAIAEANVQRFDTLVGRSLAIRDRLRDTVSALASLERTKGVPPEKMLMLLKEIVIDAEGEKLDTADARALMDDVVRWGIEAYYAA